MSDKFVSKKEANVGAFADHTIAILQNVEIDFSRNEAIYVREFIDTKSPASIRLNLALDHSEKAFESMIGYSVGLVLILENNKTEKEQIKAYADYLVESQNLLLANLKVNRKRYDQVIANIRKSDTFLDALNEAQPIINAATQYMDHTLQEAILATDALAQEIDQKVDDKYGRLTNYRNLIKGEKFALFEDLAKLNRAYKGDNEAYQSLITSKPVMRSALKPGAQSRNANLATISGHLRAKLKVIRELERSVEPEWTDYRETHSELDKLHADTINQINRARLIAILWMRAHKKMASGITDPADWFDIGKTTIKLMAIGS